MSTAKGGGAKPATRGAGQSEETEGGSKPLAATLLQEFQNLKDKFKNEDDGVDKGIFNF